MATRRLHVWVSGRVQGVYYRESTRQAASSAGVCGWVKNLADARVEAVLEGEPAAVEEVLSFMRKGPELAQVKSVEFHEEIPSGEFSDFQIVRR